MTSLARIIFALLALLCCGTWAWALDEGVAGQAERAAAALRSDLQQLVQAIDSPAATDSQLSESRGNLDVIATSAQSRAAALEPDIKEVGEQFAKLGPAPPPGQPESAEIAAQRKLLNDISSKLSGAKAQLLLVSVEAQQATGRASALQRDRFFKRVFEPSRSILNPALWMEAASGLRTTFERLGVLISGWWQIADVGANWLPVAALVLVLALLALIWGLARRVWRLRFSTDSEGAPPDNLTRLWFVIWSVALTLIASVLVTLIVFSLLEQSGLMTPRFQIVLSALARFTVGSLFASTLIYRLAEPANPSWRLLNLDNSAASRFAAVGIASALLVALSGAFRTISDGIYLTVSNSVALSAVSSLALLCLITLMLRSFRVPSEASAEYPRPRRYFLWTRRARPLIWAVLALAGGALLLGYVALADYLLFRLYDTGVFIAVLALVQYTVEAATQATAEPDSQLGRFTRRATGWSDRAIERAGLAVRTLSDVTIVLFGISTLIGLWAVAWLDLRSFANRVLFSFELGNVTISLWSILLVLIILILGIVATKAVVGWLDRRILTRVRFERGVQDSVRTSIKYAGYVLAAGFALSAAGINFSNLALVAGAFGVGIGFGLQSIVNNFVSGLILLAERPVRVGDWIITNVGEGLVKRINVRSTEIETFDGCAIIVPNSTLITEPVRNWTLGDTGGRITVAVSVPYTEDAEKIAAMLMKIMTSNPSIMSYPEPQALLSNFGAYALEFTMKFSVANIFEGVMIASDIRVAILKALAEKGVTIPIPSNISVVK
jgi:potassium-dependent mechanosensitive channel